jgi:hypothetical protein
MAFSEHRCRYHLLRWAERNVLVWGIIFLNGCAFDLTRVDYSPVEITDVGSCNESFSIERSIEVSLGTGYSRTLKAGTRWECVGRIQAGSVFESKDQLLTVEASNIHEAYIVLSVGKLVGFYLPGKNGYFGLAKPVELQGRYVQSVTVDERGGSL